MAKFKKKKFRAEKSNSEDENKDLPEIEATEDEKKEIAKWTSNPDDAPETTDAPESESKPDPTDDPIDKSATKKTN